MKTPFSNRDETLSVSQKGTLCVEQLNTHSTKIHIGMAMKELGFGYIHRGNMKFFKVVPLKAA